jgi:hypothetical protein
MPGRVVWGPPTAMKRSTCLIMGAVAMAALSGYLLVVAAGDPVEHLVALEAALPTASSASSKP